MERQRIMVVDDSQTDQLTTEKLLEGTDYELVSCCWNGQEAIEEYGTILPDLVLMDILMPEMDGLEAARIILEDHPDARIVMISSLCDDDTLDAADAIGVSGFLSKPLDREHLLATLEEVLEGEGPC